MQTTIGQMKPNLLNSLTAERLTNALHTQHQAEYPTCNSKLVRYAPVHPLVAGLTSFHRRAPHRIPPRGNGPVLMAGGLTSFVEFPCRERSQRPLHAGKGRPDERYSMTFFGSGGLIRAALWMNTRFTILGFNVM